MRIVAMIQVFNEERFIAACIEHLREQGVHVYVIDNESSDATVAIAERYLGDGVIGIETLPRHGVFALHAQVRRKEELAGTLDADWLIHQDADELRTSCRPEESLATAIQMADQAGFNAINFLEFTFVPTVEHPDHDHPEFARTMRSYYPFGPAFPYHVKAFKRQDGPVWLSRSGGHHAFFPGLRLAPDSLYLRHYMFLSRQHAIEKYCERQFAAEEIAVGWHSWRSRLRPDMIELPHESELRRFDAHHPLDFSAPRGAHILDGVAQSSATG